MENIHAFSVLTALPAAHPHLQFGNRISLIPAKRSFLLKWLYLMKLLRVPVTVLW